MNLPGGSDGLEAPPGSASTLTPQLHHQQVSWSGSPRVVIWVKEMASTLPPAVQRTKSLTAVPADSATIYHALSHGRNAYKLPTPVR